MFVGMPRIVSVEQPLELAPRMNHELGHRRAVHGKRVTAPVGSR